MAFFGAAPLTPSMRSHADTKHPCCILKRDLTY